MTKTLALIAALGLVASPVLAAEEKAAAPAIKTVKEETMDCSKAADKAACEKEMAEKKAAEGAKEAAPAAGKHEEKKAH